MMTFCTFTTKNILTLIGIYLHTRVILVLCVGLCGSDSNLVGLSFPLSPCLNCFHLLGSCWMAKLIIFLRGPNVKTV